MEPTHNKIKSLKQAKIVRHTWAQDGLKVVFTNGCFDLLHLGHVDYLEKTRRLGDKLMVGLNTDRSVRQIKGKDRPLCDEYARARILAALQFVDMVVLFDEDTPGKLISNLMPDVLTKGHDYLAENIVGADVVRKNGGEIKTITLVDGYSTSGIIEKIKML